MSNFIFKAITEVDDIKNVANQLTLTDRNTVFESSYWLQNSIDQNNISFTATDDQGQIQQALHLKTNGKLGFNIAKIASEPFIQYNDAINTSTQSTDDFFSQSLAYLKADGVDALHLHNVRADASIFKYCQKNAITIEKKQAPWVDLTAFEDYEAYFNGTSKGKRKIYRRLFRELDTEFKVYIDDEITPQLINQVIELKVKQLAETGKSSRVFADSKNIDDLKTLLNSPSKDFKTYISTIECNGVLASAAVAFIKANCYYGYIVAMDSQFFKYSPGNAHVLHNVKWSYENNIEIFDFLSPSDEYKLRWSRDNAIDVYDFLLPMSMKGKLYGSVYLTNLRPKLKSAYLYLKNFKNKSLKK